MFPPDVYWFARVESKLDRALRTLTNLSQVESKMAADLTQLQNQVIANTDVEKSAVALITGLAEQIKALAQDPAALQALADSLKASAGSLAAAIQSNTPQQPLAQAPAAPAPKKKAAPKKAAGKARGKKK